METLIAIRCEDFVMVAASEQENFHFIQLRKDTEKVHSVAPRKLLGVLGDNAYRTRFTDYIARNLALMRFRKRGKDISTKAFANYARLELASSLRSESGPYECSLVVAGVDLDSKQGTSDSHLYFLDYMGTISQVPYCSHGYGATFAMAILDRFYQPQMTQAECAELLKKCIREVQKRIIVQNSQFDVKIVSKEGVSAFIEAGSNDTPVIVT
mmetsp:Transcript_20837/g.32510  ORF Transcript_20837/g.32510 Transcript_20837/m.32510 type:complete len:212 (-) Transcript_20837:18-653(-)